MVFVLKHKLFDGNGFAEFSRKFLAGEIPKEDVNKISALHEKFISEDIDFSTNDKVEGIFHEYKSILNEKLGHIQK